MCNDRILEKLFFGEIQPYEEKVKKEHYKEIGELLEHFKGVLSDEDYEKLDHLLVLDSGEMASEMPGRFAIGFKLGFRLALEVFDINYN